MPRSGTFNTLSFDHGEAEAELVYQDGLGESLDAAAQTSSGLNILEGAGETLFVTTNIGCAVDLPEGEAALAESLEAEGELLIYNSLTRLLELLRSSGFSVAYDHFIAAPPLPFLLLLRQRTSNLYADDRVYQKANLYQIVLCTERKSLRTEKKLEAILDESEIPWEVEDESYIKEERLYQIIYSIEELED